MTAPLRNAVAFVAFCLAGCRAAPPAPDFVIDFKVFDNEPGHAWISECLGTDYKPGDATKVRIEVVDPAAAMRLAGVEPGAEPDADDFAGLRCVRID